jgi:hypothetical protein
MGGQGGTGGRGGDGGHSTSASSATALGVGNGGNATGGNATVGVTVLFPLQPPTPPPIPNEVIGWSTPDGFQGYSSCPVAALTAIIGGGYTSGTSAWSAQGWVILTKPLGGKVSCELPP